jgi:hypothetical protein
LRGGVLYLLHHEPGPIDAHLPSLAIDPNLDVLVAGDTPVGRLDRLLDGPNQLLPGDALLSVQLQERADEITTHFAPPVRFARSPSSATDI